MISPGMIEDVVRTTVNQFQIDGQTGLKEIGYDLWTFPRELKQVWESTYRWPLEARARAEYLVPATEAFLDFVTGRRFVHAGDPILDRALRNCRIKNYQGGRRPDKDPSRSMIDPAMAVLHGFSSLLQHSGDVVSDWQDPGMTC